MKLTRVGLVALLFAFTLSPAAPHPQLPGDALVYRFIDHARDARRDGPPLGAAWKSLGWPAKLPSPYSGLHGDDTLGVVELALTDPDVVDFGKPHAANGETKVVRFDPVWNRSSAVYQSKTSLFAPAATRWTFDVPASSLLRGSVTLAPGSAPVDVAIELDGQERLHRRLDGPGWTSFELPTNGAHNIRFITTGPPGAAAFWGDPQLIQKDAGAVGPNLIVVIIDTLRVDALPVMPHLQQLAACGMRFDQAVTAATWTRPSLLALLGGGPPTTLGQSAEEMIPADADRRRYYAIAPPLLPRILERQGWQADAIGNNFFLLGYPQIGLSLGFESVTDVRHPVLDTPAIERAAEAYLAEHARESFYLQVHFDGPHWPYTPPTEYLKRVKVPAGFPDDSMARAYLGEAIYADDYLGRLMDALDRLQLDERTVVVVVGDHGEIFDHAHDHKVEALGQPTLHHHGWSAYDEILRVPLVIVQPGTIAPTRVAKQVSFVDVAPTVLELLGANAGRPMIGHSLLRDSEERPAFTEGQNVSALRSGGWLYLKRADGRLRTPDGREVSVTEELYDLQKDPTQHHDLVASAPPELARLRAQMTQLQPVAPEPPLGIVHLRLAPDEHARVVEGTLHSDGKLLVKKANGAEVKTIDAHSLTVKLHNKDQIDLALDPPDAPLTLTLTRDGVPLGARDLLVGPFALPQLESTTIDATRWSWLDATRAPVDGERGDLLLWRDPTQGTEIPESTTRGNDEVAGMMRRWGYAQPGK